jgi:mRNA-degrading endonuclease RelE of RelBE toxin-antitoxin system
METEPAVVVWSQVAWEALQNIKDRSLQRKIYAKASDLGRTAHPELTGKPLRNALQGYYRIPFGRYRILYTVLTPDPNISPQKPVEVHVAFVGIRKTGDKRDVYEQAQKLRRRGLI